MKRLNRRTFLTAAGGISVGLPLLECMLNANGTAYAQASGPLPLRYAMLFAGQSLGGDGVAKTSSRIAGANITEGGHFIAPTTTGTGYTLPTPLAPLGALRNDFTVVSNLRIPYAVPGSGGVVPAGGVFNGFHGGVVSPLLSGVRSTAAAYTCNGKTSDQFIADLHTGKTNVRVLALRAQPVFYLDGYDFSGRQYVSYTGANQPVTSVTNLQVAFNSVFGNFQPPAPSNVPTPESVQFDFRQRARKSILDLVQQKRQAVLGSVGNADKQRLEKHFDELRALELRIQTAPAGAAAACVVPATPVEPAIGGNNADNAGLGTNTGYSDEDYRAQTLADIIHMAFTCDITRVATLQITTFQCHMNTAQISASLGYAPFSADLHELGHNGDPDNRGIIPVSAMLGWHVKHYAYLLQKMKDTPEGAGTLLDHSAVLFVPEGGHGLSCEDAGADNETHSTEQMAMLVAGRAGGMTPGKHLAGAGAHPAAVILAAMKAVGYAGAGLGEIDAPFQGL